MAKAKANVFFCQNCGYESGKWMGQCPGCKEWNTFTEGLVDKKSISKSGKVTAHTVSEPVPISKIEAISKARMSTGMQEFDRVLGGGIVKDSLILVGGDPGIGKSTLLLQLCRNLSLSFGTPSEGNKRSIIYVSGEESLEQIKMRADRLGEFSDSLELLSETNLSDIRQIIEQRMPEVVIIDSIQTMYLEDVASAPGSVTQVREATAVLMEIAKKLGITVFLVGHVTREGNVAGPRTLEHMVDAVLYFEGDQNESYRILRGVKNRFGSTNEIGVFEMRGEGLKEVSNPSEYMLDGKENDASGSVVTCAIEGTRPILLEVQALVCHSFFNVPRRNTTGADFNRVNLLMAVIEKKLGITLSDCDAYINIAGGMKATEPGVDLGIVLALISSKKDVPVSPKLICFGEVGLNGEVRGVTMAEQRVLEAQRLGFDTIILPQVTMNAIPKVEGIKMIGVRNLSDLANALHE